MENQDFPTKYAKMRRLFSNNYYFTNKQGQPVQIIRPGKTDWAKIKKEVSIQEVVHYNVHTLWRLLNIMHPMVSERQGRRVERIMVIIDLKDTDYLKFLGGWYKKLVQELIKLSQIYFPELLSTIYLINAPAMIN